MLEVFSVRTALENESGVLVKMNTAREIVAVLRHLEDVARIVVTLLEKRQIWID
jgi:hypothetical protein